MKKELDKALDVVCPIACGQCCDLWQEVVDGVGPDCPYITPDGCSLARADRPADCLWYMCDVGRLVFRGQRTKRWGLRMTEQGKHNQVGDRRWVA